jgi:hypothetical protein
MHRGRPWRLAYYLLAACLLVAGACPPVRFGHAHPDHGDHSHQVGIDLHDDHGDGDHHADDLAIEEGSFHWHSGLLLPGSPLTRTGGGPVEASRWDGASLSLAAPAASPGPVPGPTLLAPLEICWLPPPSSSASQPAWTAHRLSCEPAFPLVGCVLIRC